MNAALNHLNWLIDSGVEYPEAHCRTILLFGCDGNELQTAYDNQKLGCLATTLNRAGVGAELVKAKDIMVQCTRCRNKHRESERIQVAVPKFKRLDVFKLVCPRCRCKSYYKVD